MKVKSIVDKIENYRHRLYQLFKTSKIIEEDELSSLDTST